MSMRISVFLMMSLIALVVGTHHNHHEKEVKAMNGKVPETLTVKKVEDLTDRMKRNPSTFPVVRFGIPSGNSLKHLETRSKPEEVKKEVRSLFQNPPPPALAPSVLTAAHEPKTLAIDPQKKSVAVESLKLDDSSAETSQECDTQTAQTIDHEKIYNILDIMGKCLKHPNKENTNQKSCCSKHKSSSSSCSSSSSSSSSCSSSSSSSSSCDSKEYDYQFKYCYGKKGTKANMQFPY